jgi:hypothetical protein
MPMVIFVINMEMLSNSYLSWFLECHGIAVSAPNTDTGVAVLVI